MSVRYVVVLFSVFLLVLVLLAVQLLSLPESGNWTSSHSTSKKFTSTEYHFQNVDFPIQPLPRIVASDTRWVQLGKALFNSPLLSADNSVSCASCHDIYHGGDDGFSVSTGIHQQLGDRNSPTVINSVFNFRQFWDGRSRDLKDQAVGPIHNPIEMGSNWPEVIKKLRAEPSFNDSFFALSDEGVTVDNILKAIVSFEESLISENSAIDAYLMGDRSALTAQQKRGLEKFVDYGCVTCHQGRNIGGNLYQKIGRLDQVPETLLNDPGRYSLTQSPQDMFVFKVPSLRNVANTAPYFHNGTVDDLSDAIRIMAKGQLGLELEEEDVADIEALLHSFTGEIPRSLNQ